MGTNWFMPAFVKSRFGESGSSDEDGTMVCCFSRKKSRKDWRIWAEVMMGRIDVSAVPPDFTTGRAPLNCWHFVRVDEQFPAQTIPRMKRDLVFEIQRLYPQIYLACHVDHVRARSTEWRLSARDSSLLAHLDRTTGTSPKTLADHLDIAPSTLSAAITRLRDLGYIRSQPTKQDKRQRHLRLTDLGADAMAATSVLDRPRVEALVAHLSPAERKTALAGLALIARAARQLEKRS